MNELLAKNLAAAKLAAAEARENLDKARAHTDNIAGKISAATARRQAITSARLEGEGTPEDAAEYTALGGDIEALEAMHQEAAGQLLTLGQATASADASAARQQQAWDRHEAEEQFNALAARTVEIEALLVKSIVALHESGQAIGHRFISDSWRMSPGLDRIHRLNTLPTIPQEVRSV